MHEKEKLLQMYQSSCIGAKEVEYVYYIFDILLYFVIFFMFCYILKCQGEGRQTFDEMR